MLVIFVQHILGGRGSALETNQILIHTNLSLREIKPLVLEHKDIMKAVHYVKQLISGKERQSGFFE